MTNFAVIGDSVESYGHPGACSEPAPGSLAGSSILSVNGIEVGIENNCTLDIPSHGHDTDSDGNCISYSSHSIVQEATSGILSINGKQAYLNKLSVATDPGSSGDVDYTSSQNNILSTNE
jgi:hypothetical protein